MIVSAPALAADPHVVAEVLAMQRAAYAVEADLIGDDRLPPLHEDEHAIASWSGRWTTAWEGVDLLGAIAWTDDGQVLELAKVMVHPAAMRRGVASVLLARVLADSGAARVVVATGRDNVPATGFYRRHGFDHAGDRQVPPGVWVSAFRLDR